MTALDPCAVGGEAAAATQPCGCDAMKKALSLQVRELRHALEEMASELMDALCSRDDALKELAAGNAKWQARHEEDVGKIAALQAWAELQVSGGWEAGGGSPGGSPPAVTPSGAYLNDILSTPSLAVQTALPAAGAAAARGGGGALASLEVVGRDKAAAARGGGRTGRRRRRRRRRRPVGAD